MVTTLVDSGAVQRTVKGYTVAGLTIEVSGHPYHSTHSKSVQSGRGHAREEEPPMPTFTDGPDDTSAGDDSPADLTAAARAIFGDMAEGAA